MLKRGSQRQMSNAGGMVVIEVINEEESSSQGNNSLTGSKRLNGSRGLEMSWERRLGRVNGAVNNGNGIDSNNNNKLTNDTNLIISNKNNTMASRLRGSNSL